jgi:hypothetical protein
MILGTEKRPHIPILQIEPLLFLLAYELVKNIVFEWHSFASTAVFDILHKIGHRIISVYKRGHPLYLTMGN